MDPFAALGLPRRYEVDLEALERTHRELSRALHPDRYAGGGAHERRLSLSRAAEVNEAYRVLRDPVRRAEALFALFGVRVGERNEPAPAPELLITVMELREALGDARAARDAAKIHTLSDDVQHRARDAEQALARGFRDADGAPRGASEATGTPLSHLVPRLGELRFYRRFLEEARAAEDELES
jgi:molecular chaperone HscB